MTKKKSWKKNQHKIPSSGMKPLKNLEKDMIKPQSTKDLNEILSSPKKAKKIFKPSLPSIDEGDHSASNKPT